MGNSLHRKYGHFRKETLRIKLGGNTRTMANISHRTETLEDGKP
jgi:hypothetical protein